ncbi:IclR helix-turn-helix domain-containing protein [Bartonella apihabitans]|uniref:IclR helix-turn-helix domain-containing protein n=1 Tax=Bartonella apihabitans TaxID=2750929 RepID=A0A1U9MCA5_9HYPH|nr:IclR helix-turn-helix domain-containing protein [Bartonella apihabitans]
MVKNTDKPFEPVFAVLDYVASSLRAVSTTEISEELKLPLNTTHRIVANLAAQGFLRRVEDARKIVVGPVLDPETGFARRKVADRIVFMDHGAIVEEDTPETFFKSPKTDRAREFLNQILH